LFAVENPQLPIQALLFERVEFRREVDERIATHVAVGL
jgi:hypothetical protein